jgi:hypothetical protein
VNNHSLINASRNTHAKMALLGIAISLIFVAVISASSLARSDARMHGPLVKAATTTTVAGGAVIR